MFSEHLGSKLSLRVNLTATDKGDYLSILQLRTRFFQRTSSSELYFFSFDNSDRNLHNGSTNLNLNYPG